MRKLCLKENVSPSLLVRNSLEFERHENFIIIEILKITKS